MLYYNQDLAQHHSTVKCDCSCKTIQSGNQLAGLFVVRRFAVGLPFVKRWLADGWPWRVWFMKFIDFSMFVLMGR